MEERPIPRMRTASKIVVEIKAMDPGTEITEYCVRQMVKTGAVPVVWAGNKALINLNDVLALLQVGAARPIENTTPTVRGIRRVNL